MGEFVAPKALGGAVEFLPLDGVFREDMGDHFDPLGDEFISLSSGGKSKFDGRRCEVLQDVNLLHSHLIERLNTMLDFIVRVGGGDVAHSKGNHTPGCACLRGFHQVKPPTG